MQNNIRLSLSLSTALLLTACGGGGGGDNNPPLDPGTPPANIPGNNAGNSVSGIYRGTAVVVPSGSTINSSHRTLNIGSDNLNTLNVNGKQFNLRPVNENGSITTTNIRSRDGKSYEIFVVSNFDYQNSRYGYIKSGNEDYIFSQGTPTARMPGSGIAQYVGQAAFVHNGEAGTGDTRFTADFAAKTLNGTITSKDHSVTFTPVTINATINGNSFATANGAAVSSGGHFYGDNARELGGLFSDTVQRLSGSFGAIRQ